MFYVHVCYLFILLRFAYPPVVFPCEKEENWKRVRPT